MSGKYCGLERILLLLMSQMVQRAQKTSEILFCWLMFTIFIGNDISEMLKIDPGWGRAGAARLPWRVF